MLTEEQKKDRAAKKQALQQERAAEREAKQAKFPGGWLTSYFANPSLGMQAGEESRLMVMFERKFLGKVLNAPLDQDNENHLKFHIRLENLPLLAGFIHALIIRYNFMAAAVNEHLEGLKMEPLKNIQEAIESNGDQPQ